MPDGKCTFGTRAPIDINMLNETISREVKHFRNYKIYRPNFGAVPMTAKFYARHDQLKVEMAEEKTKIEMYYKNVQAVRAKGPQVKYPAPITNNQIYGWYYKPLMPIDRNDKRFYMPQTESVHTKIETIIKLSNPKKTES